MENSQLATSHPDSSGHPPLFAAIEPAPTDPIFGVNDAFLADTNPKKVNLGVGVYYNDQGQVPMLRSVHEAQTIWAAQESSKTYLPIDGLKEFNAHLLNIVFGPDSAAIKDRRVGAVQTLGGSGALRVAGDFLRKWFPSSELYLSDPSWENHRSIFEAAGLKVHLYPYYDAAKHGIDGARLLETFSRLPARSIVVIHACCHNPTGCDLSLEEWRGVIQVLKRRSLIPLIDFAYQGLGAGLVEDRRPIDLLVESGLPFFVASSFSKNFSLYRERVGGLSLVTETSKELPVAIGQVKRTIRALYSNPPSWGSKLVDIILSSPQLRATWEEELNGMRVRLVGVRKLFVDRLDGTRRGFGFVLQQRGMFSYSGLTPQDVIALRDRFGLHMLTNGRICMAALNQNNIDYVCDSIRQVVG